MEAIKIPPIAPKNPEMANPVRIKMPIVLRILRFLAKRFKKLGNGCLPR